MVCIWGVGMSGAGLHMYVHACVHGYMCFNAGSDSVYRASLGLGARSSRPGHGEQHSTGVWFSSAWEQVE